ncbi:hypothetical protein [Streptomyces sp. NPDC057382]|uniref:hypothetical protein n=1 Tax=unclassified Streptomyces TaxID=2593676 RepID=UPI00363B11EB
MELTDAGVALVVVVLLFSSALSRVLESVAFRNRAAGKAEMIRAKAESGKARGKRRARKGRRG